MPGSGYDLNDCVPVSSISSDTDTVAEQGLRVRAALPSNSAGDIQMSVLSAGKNYVGAREANSSPGSAATTATEDPTAGGSIASPGRYFARDCNTSICRDANGSAPVASIAPPTGTPAPAGPALKSRGALPSITWTRNGAITGLTTGTAPASAEDLGSHTQIDSVGPSVGNAAFARAPIGAASSREYVASTASSPGNPRTGERGSADGTAASPSGSKSRHSVRSREVVARMAHNRLIGADCP